MQSKTRSAFLHPLLFAWLVLCLTLFIYISRVSYVPIVTVTSSKAFGEMLTHISPIHYILDLIGALLGVALFSAACVALGLGVLRPWVQPQASTLALAVTAFVIGEILFSLIFLTFVSVYRLTPAIVIVTLSLGLLVGFPTLKTLLGYLPPRSNPLAGFGLNEKIILTLAIINLILGLSLSATRLGYDAAAEYFSHAKIMAVTQSAIFYYPNESFVVSSFHPGILFTAIIQLFGDQAARMLSWVNGVAILLMGAAILNQLGMTRRAQLWFMVLLATSTAFIDLLGDGKIELISTAPILAAVYWMVCSARRPTGGMFALIGLLSGFAIISRPYNIFLVSFFIVLFMIGQAFVQYRRGHSDFKHFMQSTIWIVPPLLALGVFHLLQNWIWLNSPIAPLTYARGLSSSDWQWQLDPANLRLYRLFYPLTLTFLNSPQSMGNISPLLVGFLPFLFVKSVRKNLEFSALLKLFTAITIFTLIVWIAFFFTVLEIRYVLFLWIILFLPMAQILEHATQRIEILNRPLLMPLVVIFLTIMGIRTLLIAFTAYIPTENISKDDCYDTNLCNFVYTINQPAATGDRVLVLHAYRYYLRSDLFACSSRVDEYNVLQPLARQNSEEFWVEVYRRGYQFIMFEQHLSEDRYNFGKLPNLDTVPEWLQIQTLYSSPQANQIIYRLKSINPPIPVEISCRKDSNGIWQLIPKNTSQP